MGSALTYLADAAVTTSKIDGPEVWDEGAVSAAACSMQGWRRSMEDSHFIAHNKEMKVFLFGVFDGHGGSGVSRYCAKRMPELVFQNENFRNGQFDVALHEAFMQVDLETQTPSVQEELFVLHKESKQGLSAEDLEKVQIHLSLETILDLFLGDPSDPLTHPADPFKVFMDDYSLPNPLEMKKTPPSEQPVSEDRRSSRRSSSSNLNYFTTDPRSPWGMLASKFRQNQSSPESEKITTDEFRRLIQQSRTANLAVPLLMRLRSEEPEDWSAVLSDPLHLLFQGTLVDFFRMHEGPVPWIYSIHPVDLLAVLSSDYLVDVMEIMDVFSPPSRKTKRCVSEDQGCTATVCLLSLSKENAPPVLYCANAGDSRAILVREGKAVPLSMDHKPGLKSERRRVLYAGGKVLGKLDPRVQGDLNLSRAIGDWRHKQNKTLPLELQMISPRPDISVTTLGKGDTHIVLACDGVWERFSSPDCAAFISSHHQATEDPSQVAREICEATVRKPDEFAGVPVGVTIGCDNMTAVIVNLGNEVVKNFPAQQESSSVGSFPVLSFGEQVPQDWRPPVPPQGTKKRGTKRARRNRDEE